MHTVPKRGVCIGHHFDIERTAHHHVGLDPTGAADRECRRQLEDNGCLLRVPCDVVTQIMVRRPGGASTACDNERNRHHKVGTRPTTSRLFVHHPLVSLTDPGLPTVSAPARDQSQLLLCTCPYHLGGGIAVASWIKPEAKDKRLP